jgi:hypothetical protein
MGERKRLVRYRSRSVVSVLQSTNSTAVFLALLVLYVLVAGCASTSRRDPLEGWKDLGSAYVLKGCPFGQTIKDDYQNYIQKLPQLEKASVNDFNVHFYEGINRQRAVKITTTGEGLIGEIWWERILIYNASDERIKTIKHKVGRFLS